MSASFHQVKMAERLLIQGKDVEQEYLRHFQGRRLLCISLKLAFYRLKRKEMTLSVCEDDLSINYETAFDTCKLFP